MGENMMSNNLLKLTVFLITLGLGLLTTFGLDLNQLKLKQLHQNEKIVVLFKGFSEDENGKTTVDLEIVNLSGSSVKYLAFDEEGFMIHQVEFNGEVIPEFWCGTGLEEFYLTPGNSIKMTKDASYLFKDKSGEDGTFRIGFSLAVDGVNYDTFWTEKIEIPENLKMKINRERLVY